MPIVHTTTFALRLRWDADLKGIPFIDAELIDVGSGRILNSCGVSKASNEAEAHIRRLAEEMCDRRHGIGARDFLALWNEREDVGR